MPVDLGKHVIEATAPGKKKWSTTIDVAANGARVSVDVPALQDESQVGTAFLTGATGTTKEAEAPGAGSSTQRTVAIGVGAVGVVGLAAGTFFGLKAKSNWSDADGQCGAHTNCSTTAVQLGHDAHSQATLATVAFTVGIVGIAAGAVLWF